MGIQLVEAGIWRENNRVGCAKHRAGRAGGCIYRASDDDSLTQPAAPIRCWVPADEATPPAGGECHPATGVADESDLCYVEMIRTTSTRSDQSKRATYHLRDGLKTAYAGHPGSGVKSVGECAATAALAPMPPPMRSSLLRRFRPNHVTLRNLTPGTFNGASPSKVSSTLHVDLRPLCLARKRLSPPGSPWPCAPVHLAG